MNLEGINDYLELENERFEALQKFLKEEYLQLSSTRREWITESFRTALRNAPPESYLKARTLLGGEWLPERTPELDLEAKPPFPMQAAYMLLQYNTDTWENLGLPSRDIEALLAIKNANRETRMRYITARGPVRVDKMNQELRAIARDSFAADLSEHSQQRPSAVLRSDSGSITWRDSLFSTSHYRIIFRLILRSRVKCGRNQIDRRGCTERTARRRNEIDRTAIVRFFDGKSRSRLLNLQRIP